MKTLYDVYNTDPLRAMIEMCRESRDDSQRRAFFCCGLYPGKEGNVSLHVSYLLTGKLGHHYFPEERLKDFEVITLEDLSEEEMSAFDRRARLSATVSKVFAELSRDPDAGKGPEHFGWGFSGRRDMW